MVEVPLQEGGVNEHLLRRKHPQELLLVLNAGAPTVSQVGVHVWRNARVGHTAVDEKWGKLFELLPQLPRDFDVNLRKPELSARIQLVLQNPCGCFGVFVMADCFFTTRHILQHCAGIEGVGVVPQDALRNSSQVEFVRPDTGLTGHVLAGEHQAWATYYSRLQHVVSLFAGGVEFWGIAAFQRASQNVLHRDTWQRDRVFEDVYTKICRTASSFAALQGMKPRPGCCSTRASRRRFSFHARETFSCRHRTPWGRVRRRF